MFKSSSAGMKLSNCLSELNYFLWLFIFKRCSFSRYQSSHVVIEQHHETIYSTVEKPSASQTSPANNTVSSKVETLYDTPPRHVCNIFLNDCNLTPCPDLFRCSKTLCDLFLCCLVSCSDQGMSSGQCGGDERQSGATAIWTRQNYSSESYSSPGSRTRFRSNKHGLLQTGRDMTQTHVWDVSSVEI